MASNSNSSTAVPLLIKDMEVMLLRSPRRPAVPTLSTWDAPSHYCVPSDDFSLFGLSGSGLGSSQSTRIDRGPYLPLSSVSHYEQSCKR